MCSSLCTVYATIACRGPAVVRGRAAAGARVTERTGMHLIEIKTNGVKNGATIGWQLLPITAAERCSRMGTNGCCHAGIYMGFLGIHNIHGFPRFSRDNSCQNGYPCLTLCIHVFYNFPYRIKPWATDFMRQTFAATACRCPRGRAY